MSAINMYSRLLANLLADLGSPDFSKRLIAAIRSLVPVDEATVIVYYTANLPQIDFADPHVRFQPNLEVFLNGAFLLDPYYVAATKMRKSGFFQLRELAPSGFRRSEYFRIYYRQSGLRDECGYLIPLEDGGFINLALGKTVSRSYSGLHMTLLRNIEPLVTMLCRMHWRQKTQDDQPGTNLRGALDSALKCFGTSVLTRRESQVVNLILLGHSTRKLAEVLKISPETVKLHRKHAYKKLDISTQSELFHLFIDSLKSANGYSGDDPLIAYQQKPRQPVNLAAIRTERSSLTGRTDTPTV